MLIFLLKTKETAGNLRFPQLNKVGLRQILFDFKLYIGGFSSPFLKKVFKTGFKNCLRPINISKN